MLAVFISPKCLIAGIIPSRGSQIDVKSSSDYLKIQAFYEKKIVRLKLIEYGVSPDLAFEKIRNMNERDMHLIASMVDRIPEGGADSNYDVGAGFTRGAGIGVLVGLAVAIVIGICWIILKLIKGEFSTSTDTPNELIHE
jgi:hypothetical protein